MSIPCEPHASHCGCGNPRYSLPTCPFCGTQNQVCWAATTYTCQQCGVRNPA